MVLVGNKKSLSCLIFGVSILLLTACSSNYEKISIGNINDVELKFAEQMALKIMNKCNTFDFTPLTLQEATPEAVKGFSATVMQQSCDLLRNKYGTYRGLEFAEAYKPINDNSHTIYRFKGNFKEAIKSPEIRITLDKTGKFAGFFTAKWMKKLR